MTIVCTASSWPSSRAPSLVTWHTTCARAAILGMPRSSGFWSIDPITSHDIHTPPVPLPPSLGTGPGAQMKAAATFPARGLCQRRK